MGFREFNSRKIILYTFIISGILILSESAFKGYFDLRFALGTAIGAVVVIVNLIILGKVMDLLIRDKNNKKALLVHLGRLFAFGATAVASYFLGLSAVLGYAAGVLSIVPAILISCLKGGR